MSNVDTQIHLKKPDISDSELAQLSELLRIPSISADPQHASDIRAAADWLVAAVPLRGSGCRTSWSATTARSSTRSCEAAQPAAPLVLCYGHFDVQSPAPPELWDSEPFSPDVRDGWLYARGVADDKGGSWALARAALDLSAEGELPVDVRFLLDCEEEVGGTSIPDYLEEIRVPAQACVIFDTPMLGRRDAGPRIAHARDALPARRGGTGERDLHRVRTAGQR